MSTVVYGASDDLIEIDGPLNEEFSASDDERNLLAFSTGVVLEVKYDEDGVWRIRPIAGASRVTIEFAPDDDDRNYTDRATLTEDPAWVVFGHRWVKP